MGFDFAIGHMLFCACYVYKDLLCVWTVSSIYIISNVKATLGVTDKPFVDTLCVSFTVASV